MKYLLSIAAIALAGTGWVRGATEAIAGYTDSISGYVSGTVGWTFQATRALTVTELGCFADVFVNNPTVASIQVGLWSTNGTLLASNSVAAASPLFGQTRYESVAPVMLDPGQTYHLGVFYFANSIGVDVAGAVAGGSVSTAVGVQLGAMAVADSGFAFPAAVAGTAGSLYAGPNFRFQSLPTLSIRGAPGSQVRLSWPTAYTGFSLQSKSGLFGTWAGAGLPVTTAGNEFAVFDNIGSVPRYYRLIK